MPYPATPYLPPVQTVGTDPTTNTQQQHIDVVGNAYFTDGGLSTVAIAASVATDTVVKASPGRLCKVLVTTTGTNPLTIWDNASGHTGTIIGAFAASPAVGTVMSFQMPAANGITVQGNSNNPAVTISFV